MLKIKSKVFAGLMVALALFVGANFVSADSISLPSTGVKKTSGTVIIKNLQSFLNWSLGSEIIPLVVDGKYGAKTTSAIKKYQANNGLSADGAFGKLSAAKAMALQANGGPSNNGCSAGQMYNSTTGTPCGGSTVSTVPGCTTTSGYSVTTGASCMGGSTNQTGPLTVSLSSNNPATGTIVKGQATADLAHFTFSGTGTISAITLQRSGISDQGTLKNVYLYDGMTRLTDGYSFNNTGTLTMGSLNIPISGTKVISVLADVDPSTTSYNIAVSLTSYTVVGGTTNTVSINGNSMFIATGSNLTAAALSANQIAVGSSPSVNPGTTGFTLWSAPININGNHSLFMKSANFRTIGSAPSDALANIKLYEDGIAVGNAGTMSVVNGSNYIVFDMSGSPIELTTGQHTLDVRADIVKGSARTIQISLQQASDLMLYDSQVGVNVSVTGTPNATANSISISQGTLSIAVDPTFQSLTTVTGGSTNVTIAKFKLHAYGEDVKVNSLDILPVLGGAMSNGLSNVTAYFNGSQVGTQTSSWVSSAINLTPGSQMIVPAGIDSYLEIKSDIRDPWPFSFYFLYPSFSLFSALSLSFF
jgi:peptidoglycan hydrolase-like protein with peptidoglycan-binding domain